MATRTILLIDYDPVTVKYTRESLVAAGYTVEVASDGPAGVAAFRESRPDLVLVEAMIPKQHGFEVCKEIKDASEQQTPVVITTSSFSGRKYQTEARQDYGCDEYLEKPIAQSRLLSVCEELIELAENHALGQAAEPEATFAEESPVQAAPALDELNEDELIARLDSMLPEEDEAPAEPATFLTVDSTGSEGEMPAYAGDDVSLSSPDAAGLPVALTEDDIFSQVDTVLSRQQSQAEAPATPQPPAPSEVMAQTEAVLAAAGPPAVPVETAPRGRSWIGVAVATSLLGSAAAAYLMGWYPGATPAQPARSTPAQLSSQAQPVVPVPAPAAEQPPERTEIAARETEELLAPEPAVVTPALSEESAPPLQPESVVEVKPSPEPEPQPQPQPPVEVTTASTPDPAPTEEIAQLPVHEAVAETISDADSAQPLVTPEDETIAIDSLPTRTLPAPALEPVVEAQPPAPPKTLPGALIELSATDTAPVGIHRTPPEYDRISRHLGEEGIVEMKLLIDEKGRVVDVEVTRGVNPRLDKSAARGAGSWRYEPATKDGVPVKTWMSVQVEFKL